MIPRYLTLFYFSSKLLCFSGRVHVYILTDDRAELKFSHVLVVNINSSISTTSAPVELITSLHWTSDGHIPLLAVGASSTPSSIGGSEKNTGSVSVWSAFGNLLFSTLSVDGNNGPEEAADADERETSAINWVVSSLFWGTGSFELFVLANRGGSRGGSRELFAYIFF